MLSLGMFQNGTLLCGDSERYIIPDFHLESYAPENDGEYLKDITIVVDGQEITGTEFADQFYGHEEYDAKTNSFKKIKGIRQQYCGKDRTLIPKRRRHTEGGDSWKEHQDRKQARYCLSCYKIMKNLWACRKHALQTGHTGFQYLYR